MKETCEGGRYINSSTYNSVTHIHHRLIEYGLTSHWTHYRSYRGHSGSALCVPCLCYSSGGWRSPSGVQGRNPWGTSQSPPEAEEFCRHWMLIFTHFSSCCWISTFILHTLLCAFSKSVDLQHGNMAVSEFIFATVANCKVCRVSTSYNTGSYSCTVCSYNDGVRLSNIK